MNEYRKLNAFELFIMIALLFAFTLLFFCTGCGTLGKIYRHETRYEAAKVQKENFKKLADAWLMEWIAAIAPATGGGSAIAGLIAYLSHKRGKQKGVMLKRLGIKEKAEQ